MNNPTYSYAQLLHPINEADMPDINFVSGITKREKPCYTDEEYADLLLAIKKRIIEMRLDFRGIRPAYRKNNKYLLLPS